MEDEIPKKNDNNQNKIKKLIKLQFQAVCKFIFTHFKRSKKCVFHIFCDFVAFAFDAFI